MKDYRDPKPKFDLAGLGALATCVCVGAMVALMVTGVSVPVWLIVTCIVAMVVVGLS